MTQFTTQHYIMRALLKLIDPDPGRPGLAETPRRYLAAMEEWTAGYAIDPKGLLKEFSDGAERYDEMVFSGGIYIHSLCEHHLTPFFGVVHIGYIPNGKIVGLSKLGRLADCFARRLQVQERMTVQIADTLDEQLKPKGVGVVARCRHLCMESRGLRKPGILTYTSALRGVFKESDKARAEFLQFVALADAKMTGI
jgi:GTP cyclohydrolase IA